MAYIGSKPADKPVVASDLDPAVITGQTALATAPADTDEFLISDAGVLKRIDASLVIPSVANTPAFSVYNSAQQTIGNATDTDIVFNSELFDTDNAFASNTFTVPSGKGGYYFITALVVLETNITSRFWMNIKVDGNVGLGCYGAGAGLTEYRSASASMIKNLAAGAAVKVQVQQASGGNAVTYNGQNGVFMAGFKLI